MANFLFKYDIFVKLSRFLSPLRRVYLSSAQQSWQQKAIVDRWWCRCFCWKSNDFGIVVFRSRWNCRRRYRDFLFWSCRNCECLQLRRQLISAVSNEHESGRNAMHAPGHPEWRFLNYENYKLIYFFIFLYFT